MKLGSAGFGWVLATLFLGCSGTKQSATPLDGSSGGDAATGGTPTTDPRPYGAFEPVPRAHPAESGQWVVDPSTLYALGQRSMRSRDGGRSCSELHWPEGAPSLGFSQAPRPALFLLGERGLLDRMTE